jgi:uncharacterized protein YbaP (TraB family)
MRNAILVALIVGLFSTDHVEDKALLYEVSGKGIAQPSYLYGTFHIVCPADLKLTPATSRAMNASQQLYLELDMDDPTLQPTLAGLMMLPDGKTLKDFMTAADYAVLDRYATQNLGAGLSRIGMLKPIALEALIFQKFVGCDSSGYDRLFAQMAGNTRKPVLGLETAEQQISILDRVPMKEQIQGLMEMARKPDDVKKEITLLMAAYKAQDLPQLMKLSKESELDTEGPQFMDEVLSKRNQSWIPVIEKAARNKPTFFAFGALHLGGESGVVNLLRAKGYTVKAIR